MSALDILPPSAPGAAPQKRSIFSKLFGQKEAAPPMPPPPSPREELSSFERRPLEEETFDLEDIKRKIGVEEPAEAPPALPREPIRSDTPVAFAEEQAEAPVKLEREFSIDDDLPPLPTGAKPPVGTDEWSTEETHKDEQSWAAPAEAAEQPHEWAEPPETQQGTQKEESEERPATRSDWTEEPTTLQRIVPATPDVEVTSTPEDETPAIATRVATAHLDDLEAEHAALEQELSTLLKEPQLALPPAQHPLEIEAPEGQEFLLKNGQPLKSMRELLEALEIIDTETFFHHVNVDRNDFANWLRHVFNEEQLATELAGATSRKELLKILQAHGKKVDKKFADEEKRLDAQNQTRAKKLERAAKLHGKLAELKVDLARKATALSDDRALFSDDVKQRIGAEVTRRMKEEHKKTDAARKEAELTKREYERRLKAVSAALDRREQRVAEKEEAARRAEQEAAQARRELAAQQEAAQPSLAQAKTVGEQQQANGLERARLEEERKHLFAEREKLTADRRAIGLREANITRREAAVQKERADFAQREESLAKKEKALQDEQKAFAESKTFLVQQEKSMKEEERKALARLKAEEERADEKEKKAEHAERKLHEQLRERRKVSKYIEDAEKKIAQHEERLSKEGMHGYLSAKLKTMDEADVPPAESVRNLKIYAMVDKAREALQHGETSEARELYTKIRESFNRGKFSSQEKSVLYTAIRELYDDIQLSSMKN